MSLKILLNPPALSVALAAGALVACGNDGGGSENPMPTSTLTSESGPSGSGGTPDPGSTQTTMPSSSPTSSSTSSSSTLGGQGGTAPGAGGAAVDPSNMGGSGTGGASGGADNAGGEQSTGGTSAGAGGEGGETNAGGDGGVGGASAGGSGGMASGGAGGSGTEADATAVAELSTTGVDGEYADVSGTATFSQVGDAVTLVLELQDCPMGPHISHLHVTPNCGNDGNAAGNHWLPNGELITDYSCSADGTATYTITIDDGRWTIGSGNADTDVDGHAFMVHAGTAVAPGDRVACGVIEQQ